MDFNQYQTRTLETAVYPGAGYGGRDAIEYCVLGLAGEAGEVAGKFSKVIRGDKSLQDMMPTLEAELGDVLWYVARLAAELGIPLEVLADRNIAKLVSRANAGTLHGDGDNR